MSRKIRLNGLTLADIAEAKEMPFTPQRIRDAERLVAEGAADVDGYGRREWWDSSCPGLRIVVTRQGGKVYFAGRIDGVSKRKPIGDTRTVDLGEARDVAGSLK